MQLIARPYARVLNARLMVFTEEQGVRAKSQTGFRPGLSTVHQLFAMQHFVAEAKHHKTPLYACFLDLKAAYDIVWRPLLWQALQRLGVHGRMLAALQFLYEGSTVRINITRNLGAPHFSKTGLKEGCPLSPKLFGLFIDGLYRYLKACCPKGGVNVNGGDKVSILGYADDFVLLADSAEGLQQLIDATGEYCVAIGMAICVPKTKTKVFTDGEGQFASWHCNGQVLEQVDKFKYQQANLGSNSMLKSVSRAPLLCSSRRCLGSPEVSVWQPLLHVLGGPPAQGL